LYAVTGVQTCALPIYTNMGHGGKILDDETQNRFFERAVLWLGGRR